jgi:hypothetical protein
MSASRLIAFVKVQVKPGGRILVVTFTALYAPTGVYFVPTGTYNGVLLIVKDSFGRQAMCEVGTRSPSNKTGCFGFQKDYSGLIPIYRGSP